MSNSIFPRFLYRLHSCLALLSCLVFSLVLAGCGVSKGSGLTTSVSVTASPTSISSGASSTLTVTASNATRVTISGSDGSSYTMPGSGGTQAVSPKATTTYTVTATGSGGTATSTATVTVTTGGTAAPTVSITANPTSIVAGSSSTLTVTAANATGVTISGSDGSSYTLPGTGGTQSVTPAATTTYTATATGAGGSVKATATVTVGSATAPTVTITANPTSITAGSSSILTVVATNATTVTITGTDKSSYSLTATGGIQSVTPAATTTYTATATGPNGTATATATITVTPNPPPTVTITASPTSITSGSDSTLTVTASNATAITIAGSDGSSYTISSTSGGLQTVSPTSTTTYTATATGPGGTATATATVTVTGTPAPTVTIAANPATVVTGNSSTLTVTATNATTVTITGSDSSSYSLSNTGGNQSVSPTATTTYTATATGAGGKATASVTVTVTATGSIDSISHVVFMMQENHTFDNYFGELNTYRISKGWTKGDDGNTYTVDGIDPPSNPLANTDTISNTNDEGTKFSLFKLASTCVDDESSAWLESFGDVNTYNFAATRPILMNGFVHNAEGFAKACVASGTCSGSFTDTSGQRAMGYYDDGFLNYYYYMASQFAISDRWFSPVASKTIDNRIATFTGGTTQGLVKDPSNDDKLPQLSINTIFQELDNANVSWKIYYTVTQGDCTSEDDCPIGASAYPATNLSELSYAYKYLRAVPSSGVCPAPTVLSGAVGDNSGPNGKGSFCIDPNHIAPLTDKNYGYYADLTNGTLPSFSFIEAGYSTNDEHPGSSGNILVGQAQVAKLVSALMASPEWKDSVFFFAYDEGGGPYEHVPPVPGHSNDFTTTNGQTYPDIGSIAVNPDNGQGPSTDPNYFPCVPQPNPPGTPTTHCDLSASDPGATPTDAAAQQGFGAQLGFRVPNIVISPFSRRHYVSHIPMDHTAIIKFVENRFIGPSAHLTARDAAQPDLLDFFDFSAVPWSTPPTPPTPVSTSACNASTVGGPAQ